MLHLNKISALMQNDSSTTVSVNSTSSSISSTMTMAEVTQIIKGTRILINIALYFFQS